MYLKSSITFPANAGVFGSPSSSRMHIEVHCSRIIYETSLMVDRISSEFDIMSPAIESLGVIDCSTRTFFCSRQIPKPTFGACNTVVSVNESCEKTTSLWKDHKTHQ